MKKFYSLAVLLAATALSASAFNKLPIKDGTPIKLSNSAAIEKLAINHKQPVITEGLQSLSQMPKKHQAKAAQQKVMSREDLVGNIFSMGFYYYSNSYDTWFTDDTPLEVYDAGDYASDGYDIILNNFRVIGFAAIAKYDEETGEISIPMQQVYGEEDEETGTVYNYYISKLQYVTGQGWGIDSSDIVLSNDGNSFANESDYWGIILEEVTDEGSDSGLADLDAYMYFDEANTMFQYTETYEDEDYTSYKYELSEYADNVLTVYNCAGFGCTVKFDINAEAKTATATKQVIYEPSATSFYYLGTSDGTKEVVGQIITSEEYPGYSYIYIPDFSIISGTKVVLTYTNAFFVVPFDLTSAAGVKNITVDNNNNGEVEYFNLQGVRVDNPTPGQLVIKRQNGVSSKQIIK